MGHFSVWSRIAVLLHDSMVRIRHALLSCCTDRSRTVESANGISIKFGSELSFRIPVDESSLSTLSITTRVSPSRLSNSDWRSRLWTRWRKRFYSIKRNPAISTPSSSINSPS